MGPRCWRIPGQHRSNHQGCWLSVGILTFLVSISHEQFDGKASMIMGLREGIVKARDGLPVWLLGEAREGPLGT